MGLVVKPAAKKQPRSVHRLQNNYFQVLPSVAESKFGVRVGEWQDWTESKVFQIYPVLLIQYSLS